MTFPVGFTLNNEACCGLGHVAEYASTVSFIILWLCSLLGNQCVPHEGRYVNTQLNFYSVCRTFKSLLANLFKRYLMLFLLFCEQTGKLG